MFERKRSAELSSTIRRTTINFRWSMLPNFEADQLAARPSMQFFRLVVPARHAPIAPSRWGASCQSSSGCTRRDDHPATSSATSRTSCKRHRARSQRVHSTNPLFLSGASLLLGRIDERADDLLEQQTRKLGGMRIIGRERAKLFGAIQKAKVDLNRDQLDDRVERSGHAIETRRRTITRMPAKAHSRRGRIARAPTRPNCLAHISHQAGPG